MLGFELCWSPCTAVVLTDTKRVVCAAVGSAIKNSMSAGPEVRPGFNIELLPLVPGVIMMRDEYRLNATTRSPQRSGGCTCTGRKDLARHSDHRLRFRSR